MALSSITPAVTAGDKVGERVLFREQNVFRKETSSSYDDMFFFPILLTPFGVLQKEEKMQQTCVLSKSPPRLVSYKTVASSMAFAHLCEEQNLNQEKGKAATADVLILFYIIFF